LGGDEVNAALGAAILVEIDGHGAAPVVVVEPVDKIALVAVPLQVQVPPRSW
jgi:hypothetical protein